MNRIPLRSPTPTFPSRRGSSPVAPPMRFTSTSPTPSQQRTKSPARLRPLGLSSRVAAADTLLDVSPPPVAAVPCPHCGIMALRSHQRKCSRRESECHQCGLHLSLASRDLHIKNECPARIVSCPGCGGSLEHHRLNNHLLGGGCKAQSFVCKPCGQCFTSPEEYVSHAIPVCRAETFSCQLCNKPIAGHQLAQHYAVCAQGVLRHSSVVDAGNTALVSRAHVSPSFKEARNGSLASSTAPGTSDTTSARHRSPGRTATTMPKQPATKPKYSLQLHPNNTTTKEQPIPRSAKAANYDAPRLFSGRSTTPNARRDILSPNKATHTPSIEQPNITAAPRPQQQHQQIAQQQHHPRSETLATEGSGEVAVISNYCEPSQPSSPPHPHKKSGDAPDVLHPQLKYLLDGHNDVGNLDDFVELEQTIATGSSGSHHIERNGRDCSEEMERDGPGGICEFETRIDDDVDAQDSDLYNAVSAEQNSRALSHRASSRSQLKDALTTSLLPRRPPSLENTLSSGVSSPTHRPVFHPQSSPPQSPLRRANPAVPRPYVPTVHPVPDAAPKLQPSRRPLTSKETFGHLHQHTTEAGLVTDKRYKRLPGAEQARILKDWQLTRSAITARDQIVASRPSTTPTRSSTPPSTKRPFKLA